MHGLARNYFVCDDSYHKFVTSVTNPLQHVTETPDWDPICEAPLVRALSQTSVRFVGIGVWGANYYATSGETLFTTEDRDLFLPSDAKNLLAAWQSCESVGLELWSGNEPMDKPLDDFLG